MFQQNKQKTIAWTKICTTREWEHLQSDALIIYINSLSLSVCDGRARHELGTSTGTGGNWDWNLHL
jgi:hypothetical protein